MVHRDRERESEWLKLNPVIKWEKGHQTETNSYKFDGISILMNPFGSVQM